MSSKKRLENLIKSSPINVLSTDRIENLTVSLSIKCHQQSDNKT